MKTTGIVSDKKLVINVKTEIIGNIEVDVWHNSRKTTINAFCPPILKIHGMFGGGWYFENWANFLYDKGLKTYVIKDLHKGENLSKVDFYTYVEKSIKVVESICAARGGKIILLGHSMGGLIAQKIAEMKPHLVAGLVLVASAPPKDISALSFSVGMAMLKHFSSIIFNLPLKIDKKTAFKLVLNWSGDEERKEQIFKKFVPESSKVAKQLAFSRILVDDRKVNCKSLIVVGLYDEMLPLESQVQIADKYSSDYRSFLNGHMLMLEDCKEEIISAIYSWLYINFIC